MEYNGRISILKLLLIIESIKSMFKILQTIHYTVHFIFLLTFPTFVLFTLILNMPAIILQTPCCHAVMTSKIPLICRSPLRESFSWHMYNSVRNEQQVSLYTYNYFPIRRGITDLVALYQHKKISLYRKNATVVLQVLQKILSLLTSGQEKKVCKYQSTVF